MLNTKPLQTLIDEAIVGCNADDEPIHAPIHTQPDGEARHRKRILQHLDHYPAAGGQGSLHIGVAGYFNLELVCKARPENVLLMDANANQQRYWQEFFRLLAANPSLENFSHALIKHTRSDGFVCDDGTFLENRFRYEDPLHGLECLQDESNYHYLHRLAVEGHAAFTTVNLIAESKKSAAIGLALREAGFHVDTAYWSNIGSFFQASRKVIIAHDDDIYGHDEQQFTPSGVHYKNSGFYKSDMTHSNQWHGYASQEERNRMDETQVPAYERFLENTSALGGLHTLHMHSHASDSVKNIKRYPLILSEGPLRRLPEQIELRKQQLTSGDPLWQERVEPDASTQQNKSR